MRICPRKSNRRTGSACKRIDDKGDETVVRAEMLASSTYPRSHGQGKKKDLPSISQVEYWIS